MKSKGMIRRFKQKYDVSNPEKTFYWLKRLLELKLDISVYDKMF